MAEYSKEQILEMLRLGQSLERADLRNLDGAGLILDGANLRRADLDGANLTGASLKNANLASASLRDAHLSKANLGGSNLQKSDLEGAKLDGADLQATDLSRANLAGASMEKARLNGARLPSAQLDDVNLGGAQLMCAELVGADLSESYLGGANFGKAEMQNARLPKANLEAADFSGANLTGADLTGCYCAETKFEKAKLEGAVIESCALSRADLRGANLKGARARDAKFDGAKMTGALLLGIDVAPDQFVSADAEWVSFSTPTSEVKVYGQDIAEYLSSEGTVAYAPVAATPMAPPQGDPNRRFFGAGDILKNATLEFRENSIVEVESTFEKCMIGLRDGARLVIGPNGSLRSCQITGAGEVVIHGTFIENGSSPGIVGPRRFIVGKDGKVAGTVKQAPELTVFAFERGCALNLAIRK